MLDEPIAGVDAESQRLFRDALVHVVRDRGGAVVLVSHELGAVADDLDRVVVLKRRVLFDGPPADLAATGVSLGIHQEDLPLWLETLSVNLPLPYPFDRDYMQLALVAGLVVALCAPLIGAFLVEKQLSLLGDGLGHLAFAGVAVGLLLAVSPLWAALVVTVVGALALEYLRSRGQGDRAISCSPCSSTAASPRARCSRAGPPRRAQSVNVLPYLFGSILTVTPDDVWLIVALGAVIVVEHRDRRPRAVRDRRRRGVGPRRRACPS